MSPLERLLTLAAVSLVASPAFANTTMDVAPAETSVSVGDSSTLEVAIGGFVGEVGVYGFQFDLSYDPSIVSVERVDEGPLLAPGGFKVFLPGEVDEGAGRVGFVAGTPLGPQPLDVPHGGAAATVRFKALARGTSPITISNAVVLSFDREELSIETSGGLVRVVPEPAGPLLCATSLLALFVYERATRRRGVVKTFAAGGLRLR